jgi:hypothetical protein
MKQDPSAQGVGKLRVLIVEDHADSATAIARLLRTVGHDARIANDFKSALALAGAEGFDLLICDISLPDGSGLDLMRQLHRMKPIKGIAMSGFASLADETNSRDAGFSAHLGKPLDFAKLRETIERVCAN